MPSNEVLEECLVYVLEAVVIFGALAYMMSRAGAWQTLVEILKLFS